MDMGHDRVGWGKQRSGQQQDASLYSSLEISSEQFHSEKQRLFYVLFDWSDCVKLAQLLLL